MTGPYAAAADTYWQAGWKGILPLPPRRKANPPAGYTGALGYPTSRPDVQAWLDGPEGAGNIGLRMPEGCLGIDVDDYGDKAGGLTLTAHEAEHGPLPETWRSTSRDDGVSGIRLYRIPEGLSWPGEIGPGIELLQYAHRYAVVWPSIHPEGRTYRWIAPGGATAVAGHVPGVEDLPELPAAWVEALALGPAIPLARLDLNLMGALGWLAEKPWAKATACERMNRVREQWSSELDGSVHAAGRNAALRIVRLTDEHHPGGVDTVGFVRSAFVAEATRAERRLLQRKVRSAGEAVREWDDLLTSAVALVAANPSGVTACDCDGLLTAGIVGNATAPAPAASEPASVFTPGPLGEDPPEPAWPKQIISGGAFILDIPKDAPSLWGDGSHVIWAVGESLMLCGPPGVGKTTITGQLVRALLGLQDSLLGYPVRPAEGRVLYLAMDRPRQIARSLRRIFADVDRDLLDAKLMVWAGPPPGDLAKTPSILLTLAQLVGATVVIIDSVKDAAVGLVDDEVGAGYNRARQTCLAAGVEVLELHHLVKKGTAGGKPLTLADVYGSMHLTSGAGSVLRLWGDGGDAYVELAHLKQPAESIGPLELFHDESGRTHIREGADLLGLVRASATGITVRQAASVLSKDPDASDIEATRRKLDRLFDKGLVGRTLGSRGGPATVYTAITTANIAGHPGAVLEGESRVSAHDRLTSTNTDSGNAREYHREANHVAPLPEGEGGREAMMPARDLGSLSELVSCRICFRPVQDLVEGLCSLCASHSLGDNG